MTDCTFRLTGTLLVSFIGLIVVPDLGTSISLQSFSNVLCGMGVVGLGVGGSEARERSSIELLLVAARRVIGIRTATNKKRIMIMGATPLSGFLNTDGGSFVAIIIKLSFS